MSGDDSSLDAEIDTLYALPPGEFVAARNALAKTLKGDAARRIKQLEKPTVVPWAVNQLYWHDRPVYEMLMAAGRALRSAQVAALEGRATDLRAATAEHRTALTRDVSAATRRAAAAGLHPAGDPLTRMLETLSTATEPPAAPGRFTEVLQPSGLEALAGLTLLARAWASPHASASSASPGPSARGSKADTATASKQAADAAAAARRAADDVVTRARASLEEAQTAETRAEALVDISRQQLARAEAALDTARAGVADATARVARAEADRAALS